MNTYTQLTPLENKKLTMVIEKDDSILLFFEGNETPFALPYKASQRVVVSPGWSRALGKVVTDARVYYDMSLGYVVYYFKAKGKWPSSTVVSCKLVH